MVLLTFGNSPASILHIMPLASGIAFMVLLATWFSAMRRHRISVEKES